MGFLFPLFLLAGLAILIPIVIHLVNLRRYKRELFPNVRFLRRLQIVSKRSAELNKKWLLLSRILFLLALVVAFAHPYWKSAAEKEQSTSGVVIIYIDNSQSMSAQSEGNTLLSLAKNQALSLINASPAETHFKVLSNNRLYSGLSMDKEEAQQAVNGIHYSSRQVSFEELKNILAEGAEASENTGKPPVYIFSDFQETTWLHPAQIKDSLELGRFYLFPLEAGSNTENVFFDSVSVQEGILQNTTSPIHITTRLGRQIAKGSLSQTLRLLVNGQTRLVKTITFPKDSLWLTDTLSFAAKSKDWTRVSLLLSDASVRFDDTFRLVLKAPVGFSVLVIAREAKINPYLQAAFQSMPGISQKVIPANQMSENDLQAFSLIVVQEGNECTPSVSRLLKKALAEGLNVLIFPGKEKKQPRLEKALEELGDIHLDAPDTSQSQVVVLQKEHPLLKGVFESVPEQVQLPVARYHFPLSAGWTSNQQDVMSFADGSPMLAAFGLDLGDLYVCTTPLDGESSNFPLSYFFAPLLYNMAVPSSALQQYFTTIGSRRPVWIPAAKAEESGRQVWHLQKKNFDQMPAQRIEGRGLAIYVGQSAENAGFYWLKQEGNDNDSIWLAVNHNPSESKLYAASRTAIEEAMAPQKVIWLDEQVTKTQGWMPSGASFPLWKIAVCIALLCLLFETWILLRPVSKKKSHFAGKK